MPIRPLLITLVVLTLAAASYMFADWYSAKPADAKSTYVGRDSCIQCHQQQYDLFHGSDHDRAMEIATDESVLADFDDQTLEHYGVTSRMYREGEKFMIHTEGPDGKLHDYQVKYTFGVRPLQQYMVELERPADAAPNEIGRVQVLRVSWDTNAKKWFYLNPPDVDEKLDPSDPLHWTGITQNWNASCAACHSTNLQKNFNPLTGEYRTTFSEIDVSCEACHGPGSLHVELANEKSIFWDRRHHYGLVNLKTGSNRTQIETCAPCHSRRSVVADGFQPGCNFDEYFALQLLSQPTYHADGQIRDEDYVYGSFIQSKMYHNGIRCTDCHDPHSTKLIHTGNETCTSCHQHPAGKYDTPSHHHHEPGTAGASCVECHMPATTYMQLDPRRDHSLRVPRPDMSVRFGTPNACTSCHLDSEKLAPDPERKPLTQYLDWIIAAEGGDASVQAELDKVNEQMATATEKWYLPDHETSSDYYERLALGHSDDPQHLPTLNNLATDGKVPAIIRASAMQDLSGDSSEQSLDTALEAITDSDPKVIAAAIMRLDQELGRILDQARYADEVNDASNRGQLKRIVDPIISLFDNPARRARMQAARVFASLPPDIRQQFSNPSQRQAFQLALDEYKKSLFIENDRAIYHMMLGGLYEMLGDLGRAKDAYRSAISVEPNLSGPRSNLAALLGSEITQIQSQMRSAQQGGQIRAGELKQNLERLKKLAAEAAELRTAEHGLLAIDIERSSGLANTHGLHYRFAMSSYVQGDLAATEKHLLEAHRQEPENATYLLGLATYYIHVEKPKVAMDYIRSLLKLDNGHPGYQALLKQAQGMIESKK